MYYSARGDVGIVARVRAYGCQVALLLRAARVIDSPESTRSLGTYLRSARARAFSLRSFPWLDCFFVRCFIAINVVNAEGQMMDKCWYTECTGIRRNEVCLRLKFYFACIG